MPALKPGHGRLSLVRLQVAHALATGSRVLVIDGKASTHRFTRTYGPIQVTAADLAELARQADRRNRMQEEDKR